LYAPFERLARFFYEKNGNLQIDFVAGKRKQLMVSCLFYDQKTVGHKLGNRSLFQDNYQKIVVRGGQTMPEGSGIHHSILLESVFKDKPINN